MTHGASQSVDVTRAASLCGMQRIAVANIKGGGGKTTAALELAYTAAERCARSVVVVDWDPQGTAADRLIGKAAGEGCPLYDTLTEGRGLAPALTGSLWSPRLRVAAGGTGLARLAQLSGDPAELYRLADALTALDDGTDLVVIDTGPQPGPLLTQALLAADVVLLTTRPEQGSLTGLAMAVDAIANVRRLHPTLRLAGVLVTDVPWRGDGPAQREHRALLDQLTADYPDLVLDPPIRRAEATLDAAKAAGLAASALRPDSQLAHAFTTITARLLDQEKP